MDNIERDCDIKCLRKGSHWSHIFFANGIILAMIFPTMICVTLGANNYKWRAFGSLCTIITWIGQLSTIAVTAAYRWSDFGQLCALSKVPTNWVSRYEVNDDWTYEKDAMLITILFFVQLATCCGCCLTGTCLPLGNQLVDHEESDESEDSEEESSKKIIHRAATGRLSVSQDTKVT